MKIKVLSSFLVGGTVGAILWLLIGKWDCNKQQGIVTDKDVQDVRSLLTKSDSILMDKAIDSLDKSNDSLKLKLAKIESEAADLKSKLRKAQKDIQPTISVIVSDPMQDSVCKDLAIQVENLNASFDNYITVSDSNITVLKYQVSNRDSVISRQDKSIDLLGSINNSIGQKFFDAYDTNEKLNKQLKSQKTKSKVLAAIAAALTTFIIIKK